MKFDRYDVIKLIISIVICEAAGIIGSLFTVSSIPTWYASLNRPDFAPPNWIFGPVWTTLYLLMGISLYLIWKHGWENKNVKIAVYVFGIQLILNVIWSVLFFGLQSPLLGMIGIVLLWIAIAVNIYFFYKVDRNSAYLLVPYIVWVSIASYLNYSILIMN